MTTASPPLEVCLRRPLEPTLLIDCGVAAFLTQTVTLDDQTSVKFEIWYVILSMLVAIYQLMHS